MEYDWTDPAIVEMMRSRHEPMEDYRYEPGDAEMRKPLTFHGIVCQEDRESWPCPTILEYRAEMERRTALAAAELQAMARVGRDARIADSARGVTPRA